MPEVNACLEQFLHCDLNQVFLSSLLENSVDRNPAPPRGDLLLPHPFPVPRSAASNSNGEADVLVRQRSSFPGQTRTSVPQGASELTLRILEPFPGALLPVLLSFLDPRVPCQESAFPQFLSQFDVELEQGPRNSQLHGVGLT